MRLILHIFLLTLISSGVAGSARAQAQELGTLAQPGQVFLLDPEGSFASLLKEAKVSVTSLDTLKSLDDLPKSARLVIIAPDALHDPESAGPVWQNLLQKGIKVLVLRQLYPARPLHGDALPFDTTLVEFQPKYTFDAQALAHPILTGLSPEEVAGLSGGKEYVPIYAIVRARNADHFNPNTKIFLLKRVVPDSVVSLGVLDGTDIYSPLLIFTEGSGLAVLCQLPVTDSNTASPALNKLFRNLLDFLLNAPTSGQKVQ